MDEKRKRIDELVKRLNESSQAYYANGTPDIPDIEWDHLYDELKKLEEETGYVRDDSPTKNVGTGASEGDGKREAHEFPALSLNKTKDISVLQKWAGVREVWLSWKLDGITLVATYDSGKLSKLATRGNGHIGTNITWMGTYISGLPMKIKDSGHIVVRGEAIITYSDFEDINENLPSGVESFENPRNLVAGTLSLSKDRSDEVRDRRVIFKPFTLVYLDKKIKSWGERMDYLKELGFDPVEHERTVAKNLPEVINRWSHRVGRGEIDYPVDGLVITYDDTVYAATGPVTGRYAVNAGMAFKWRDTEVKTTLREIEWTCGMNSITPVAVFDPVRLEGTIVKRASLCNVSELERLGIGANDQTELTVIKSNMIIPKCIAANSHGTLPRIPTECPVCSSKTEIHQHDPSSPKILRCTNPECIAKQVRKLSRFVSKAGFDINGLSTKSLMKFINMGFIQNFQDIFSLYKYVEYIWETDAFSAMVFEKIVNEIEDHRYVHPVNFLYSLCIPMIGQDAAKKIVDKLGTNGMLEAIMREKDLSDIPGIGYEKSNAIKEWVSNEKNQDMLSDLLDEVTIAPVEQKPNSDGACNGMIFVITGNLHNFVNRNELRETIESMGGKVSETMSGRTTYLINNDLSSTSTKNQKAVELDIPVLTEDDFMTMFMGKKLRATL